MAAPKILCDTAGMDRKTWLAVRAHGPDGSIPITIGGSDVAAIFGISPWKTPLDLWLEKSGKLLPNESENLWQKEIGHLSALWSLSRIPEPTPTAMSCSGRRS